MEPQLHPAEDAEDSIHADQIGMVRYGKIVPRTEKSALNAGYRALSVRQNEAVRNIILTSEGYSGIIYTNKCSTF